MRPLFDCSTVRDGNMSFRFKETSEKVIANREAFLRRHDISLDQVVIPGFDIIDHFVVQVTQAHRGENARKVNGSTGLRTNFLVTRESDIPFFFIVADCLVIGLFDETPEATNPLCAGVHVGWRETNAGIPRQAISHLVEECGIEPQNLSVQLSPARQARSSDFDTLAPFNNPNLCWDGFITPSGDERFPYRVDWVENAVQQLVDSGIPEENILRNPTDTLSNPGEYFSFRRAALYDVPDAGRQAVVVGWKPD
jgi:copper oxidase (laccase) domain-containing protein